MLRKIYSPLGAILALRGISREMEMKKKKRKKRTVAIIFVSKMYLSLDWNRKSFFRVGKRGDEYNARFADERDGKANGRNKRIVSEITISNW